MGDMEKKVTRQHPASPLTVLDIAIRLVRLVIVVSMLWQLVDYLFLGGDASLANSFDISVQSKQSPEGWAQVGVKLMDIFTVTGEPLADLVKEITGLSDAGYRALLSVIVIEWIWLIGYFACVVFTERENAGKITAGAALLLSVVTLFLTRAIIDSFAGLIGDLILDGYSYETLGVFIMAIWALFSISVVYANRRVK